MLAMLLALRDQKLDWRNYFSQASDCGTVILTLSMLRDSAILQDVAVLASEHQEALSYLEDDTLGNEDALLPEDKDHSDPDASVGIASL
jgi:hypothetical protein